MYFLTDMTQDLLFRCKAIEEELENSFFDHKNLLGGHESLDGLNEL
jgi:hypothetical protein